MLVICSDSHARSGHALSGRTLEAVREADLVVHAGDFTTTTVLDAFTEAADRLLAVHGNADNEEVRERLPGARVLEYEGVTVAVTHRRDGGDLGLRMFGRERGADLVVSGHTHRPRFLETQDVCLLNPGSHAQPRGNRPAHAELEATDQGLAGRLVQPDGTVFERFAVPADGAREGQQ
ncbi:metallophosphoesterase [Haloarchaeobius amylolyticus]|uniref:metallophosphoesterase n=1 Tax=Haloarchaeobius amylolyticus TaxID=1198296 RepID=UPI00227157E4|nr:metallophosphoesterase [Haloarchaeobius amylolyticus]